MLQVIEALYATVHPTAGTHYHSFFSSELGGIITDPALMFVHADDHMLHRYVQLRPRPEPLLSLVPL